MTNTFLSHAFYSMMEEMNETNQILSQILSTQYIFQGLREERMTAMGEGQDPF